MILQELIVVVSKRPSSIVKVTTDKRPLLKQCRKLVHLATAWYSLDIEGTSVSMANDVPTPNSVWWDIPIFAGKYRLEIQWPLGHFWRRPWVYEPKEQSDEFSIWGCSNRKTTSPFHRSPFSWRYANVSYCQIRQNVQHNKHPLPKYWIPRNQG